LPTQGSALLVTSNPDRTSPVQRGLFVLANFLGTCRRRRRRMCRVESGYACSLEQTTPPDALTVPVTYRDFIAFPIETMQHPDFETFNGVGLWRDTERKQSIAAEGSLITGETFHSVTELKRILVTGHRQDFYRTLTAKLLTYATGRGMEYYDVETIDRIVKRLDDTDGQFSALLMGVIESALFQKMRTQATMTVAN
jgi:hypothetical protein